MRIWLEGMVRDLRFAARRLRRSAGFALAVTLTLSLGLGAATAIWAVVDAVLLRPLPYRDVDRLVSFALRITEDVTVPWIPVEQASGWRENAGFLEGIAFHVRQGLIRTDGAEPETVDALAVSHDLDDLLGVAPVRGRGFVEEDAGPGASAAVILTHRYWREKGAPSDVLGSTMRLEGRPHRVIGILPRDFKFPVVSFRDVWVPLADDGTAVGGPVSRVGAVGRLRDGVSLTAAQERTEALAAAMREEAPDRFGLPAQLSPLRPSVRANPEVVRSLWMLAAAVGGMLLIALLNATNLVLVRTSVRRRELEVRKALGATRGRLARELFIETSLLALAAGAVAAVVAMAISSLLWRLYPEELKWTSAFEFSVRPAALVGLFVVAVCVGLFLGLVPALRTLWSRPAGPGIAGGGKTGGRSTGDRSTQPARRLLLVAETALSVLLLVGAGLFAASFTRLLRVDPGFEPDGLALLELSLPETRYPSGSQRAAFFLQLEERIEALPAVDAVTVTGGFLGSFSYVAFPRLEAEGREPPVEGQPIYFPQAAIAEDYLQVMGVQLLAGRNLTPADRDGGVLIDAPLARFLWGRLDVTGSRFRVGPRQGWITVAGVVEDLRLLGPDDRQGSFDVLYPRSNTEMGTDMTLAIRTSGVTPEVLASIRRLVHEADPLLPVEELVSARQAMAETLGQPRFLLIVLGVLAGVATALAMVGIYGVLSYAVSLRRREIGIRMAVGARRSRVRAAVLRDGLVLTAIGIGIGVAAALALGGSVASLLYEVEPADPRNLVGVSLLMLLVAAVACWIPAARATRVDPVEVLKAD